MFSKVRNFELDHSLDNVLIEYQAALKVGRMNDHPNMYNLTLCNVYVIIAPIDQR